MTLTVDLTPEGTATRLVATFDARPHGLMRLGFPIFLRIMRRQEAGKIGNLKKKLEFRSRR